MGSSSSASNANRQHRDGRFFWTRLPAETQRAFLRRGYRWEGLRRPSGAVDTDNVRIVRSLYEAAIGGAFDVDAFLAPLAADVEWIEPAGSPVGGTHRGHDGVMEIIETMGDDFESFEVVPERFISDGDSVAVPVTERFVLDGGEQVDVRALHLYDLEDGEIVRMENFEDTSLLD